MILNKKLKYLQIAFNRSIDEVKSMIDDLPASNRIIIEAGTPFIKMYGATGIASLHDWWSKKIGSKPYIVADLKTMDRGTTEVSFAAQAGASAVTCLGLAPIETIDGFIQECNRLNIDSMVDMMNVPFPFEILQKLKKLPDIVVLHRGVDENIFNREKTVPLNEIRRIKGAYGNIMISIAGGETTRDVIRTYFNDADIAVVWRSFYEKPEATADIARDFLKLIK